MCLLQIQAKWKKRPTYQILSWEEVWKENSDGWVILEAITSSQAVFVVFWHSGSFVLSMALPWMVLQRCAQVVLQSENVFCENTNWVHYFWESQNSVFSLFPTPTFNNEENIGYPMIILSERGSLIFFGKFSTFDVFLASQSQWFFFHSALRITSSTRSANQGPWDLVCNL